MKQFVLMYKPNNAILGWYCTKEAAWDRMEYLSDTNFFGVFEVDVTLFEERTPFTMHPPTGEILAVNVCPVTGNESVLNVVNSFTDADKKYKDMVLQGTLKYYDGTFIVGKQHKKPKDEPEADY